MGRPYILKHRVEDKFEQLVTTNSLGYTSLDSTTSPSQLTIDFADQVEPFTPATRDQVLFFHSVNQPAVRDICGYATRDINDDARTC